MARSEGQHHDGWVNRHRNIVVLSLWFSGSVVSGCGPGGATLSDEIAAYCENEAMTTLALPRQPGAACTAGGDCDSDVCASMGSGSSV